MVDKVIRGDKVAVLISPGYGSGWTSWNQGHTCVEEMLFDVDIVNAILEYGSTGDTTRFARLKLHDIIMDIAQDKYGKDYEYFSAQGLKDISITWVDVGRKFIVTEYDGSESIEFCDEMNWITA